MDITNYVLEKNIGDYLGRSRLRIALATDLHDRPYEAVAEAIKQAEPDMIAVAGDLMCGQSDKVTEPLEQENALGFLEAAAAIAPTFYSLGNHEKFVRQDGSLVNLRPITETGAVLLDDSAVEWQGIWIGALTSPMAHIPVTESDISVEEPHISADESPISVDGSHLSLDDSHSCLPNLCWLDEFNRLDGFKILLCHQPEFYPAYVKATSADIVLSGHAHGGQWRLFGRGVFAPGQGFFPKLTSGVHENRLVISRGLANTTWIPRICNPVELVIVDVV